MNMIDTFKSWFTPITSPEAELPVEAAVEPEQVVEPEPIIKEPIRFDPWWDQWVEREPVVDGLRAMALVLTKQQDENWPERDGECKRAAVYGQLTNTFPNRNKRDVSLAIEEALHV